jgi:hypothetical protein
MQRSSARRSQRSAISSDLIGVFPAELTIASEIRLHFTAGGGHWLVAIPVGVDIWMVNAVDMKRLVDPREHRFAPRCESLMRQLGWDIGEIEQLAKVTLALVSDEEHCVSFSRPIESVVFNAWQEGDVVEIDLDEVDAVVEGGR